MELDPAEKIDMNKEEELISDIDYRKDMVENRNKSSIVQLSYRFTTPMARPMRGREMKESYVYKITKAACELM